MIGAPPLTGLIGSAVVSPVANGTQITQRVVCRIAYPAHAPSGNGRSGTASAGKRPSAEPMSNSMPSEV